MDLFYVRWHLRYVAAIAVICNHNECKKKKKSVDIHLEDNICAQKRDRKRCNEM